ncbi:MAG: cysteine desulfurase family protein [Phycisphaerales bacterium]
MIFLDHNSTTRPDTAVVEAVREALETHWHNPSSVHRAGQEARRVVELARESCAALLGVRPRELTFTSGGTESIDLAIRGSLAAAPAKQRVIVTTGVEHHAVRDACDDLARRGEAQVRLAAVDAAGVVRLDALRELLTGDVALVSIQWANNETGVVQPVRDVAALCRERGVRFHCDGVQWVGKMPARLGTGPDALDCDLFSFSAHKFHGPKGAGVLYARPGVRLVPRLHGSQEQGRRGGTENVPGIAGLGVAARLAQAWLDGPAQIEIPQLAQRRDAFERAVLGACPDASVNGPPAPAPPAQRLWNTTNIAFPRLEAEAILLALSERGVCASAGAACSSGSLDPSPVILAMGVPPERAHGSVRFSLSRETTPDELAEAAGIVGEVMARLRASMP